MHRTEGTLAQICTIRYMIVLVLITLCVCYFLATKLLSKGLRLPYTSLSSNFGSNFSPQALAPLNISALGFAKRYINQNEQDIFKTDWFLKAGTSSSSASKSKHSVFKSPQQHQFRANSVSRTTSPLVAIHRAETSDTKNEYVRKPDIGAFRNNKTAASPSIGRLITLLSGLKRKSAFANRSAVARYNKQCSDNGSLAQLSASIAQNAYLLAILLEQTGLQEKRYHEQTFCRNDTPARSSVNPGYHPNIVHYIRFYNQTSDAALDFLQFISIISVERFLQPAHIYLYSNIEPHGYYYDLAKRFTYCLQFQHIDRVVQLNGKRLHYIEHEADYNKVLQVYKRGGIFLDFDAFIINVTSLRAVQSNHECVLACENGCSIVNAGFISCQQHSPFVALWLEGYTKHFNPAGWTYNSGTYPTEILHTHKYNDSLVIMDNRIAQSPQWNEKWRWIEGNESSVHQWGLKPAAHHYLKWHELQERCPTSSDLELVFRDNALGAAARYILGIRNKNFPSKPL